MNIYERTSAFWNWLNLFMITKLGLDWEKEAGINVVISNQNINKGSGKGIVHELDFRILTNIFFGKYPIKSIDSLENAIKDMEKNKAPLDDENPSIIPSLEDFIPKNNWDRYFSELLNCESEEFKKKWDTLYYIRCDVAHNNTISEDKYKQGVEHCEWLKKVLEKAIKKLTEIDIPNQEIESAVLNPIYGNNNDFKTARESHGEINLPSVKNLIETQSKISNYFSNPINDYLQATINAMNNLPISVSEYLQATRNAMDNLPNLTSDYLQATINAMNNLPISVSEYLQATRNAMDNLPNLTSDYLQATRNAMDNLPNLTSDYLQATRNISDYLPNLHLKSSTSSKDLLSEPPKAVDNGINENSSSGEDVEIEGVESLTKEENNEEECF